MTITSSSYYVRHVPSPLFSLLVWVQRSRGMKFYYRARHRETGRESFSTPDRPAGPGRIRALAETGLRGKGTRPAYYFSVYRINRHMHRKYRSVLEGHSHDAEPRSRAPT